MRRDAKSGIEDPRLLAPHADRRKANRHLAVCRIARVVRDGDAGFWRVRNISDEGVMLATEIAVCIGERLEIALSETVSLDAEIVWAANGRCGARFTQPIDAEAVLARLAEEQRSASYRAPRIAVDAAGVLQFAGRQFPVDLVDISQNGAGYSGAATVAAGQEVALILFGSLRLDAVVRWSRGGRGGLWFCRPLPRTDAESLAWLVADPSPRAPR